MDQHRIAEARHRLQNGGTVDQLVAFELGVALCQTEKKAPDVKYTSVFTEEGAREVVKHLKDELPNEKIRAIKIVRRLTGLGLREAKELVDGVWDQMNWPS